MAHSARDWEEMFLFLINVIEFFSLYFSKPVVVKKEAEIFRVNQKKYVVKCDF